MKEVEMYKPTLDILTKKFEAMGDKIHLEITSEGRFSRKIREALHIDTLQIIRVDKLRPDLTGYYIENDRKLIIIVEVKVKEITLMDISQANTYADIFDAFYCILVSSEPLGREKRIFIKNKGLVHRGGYRGKLIISWYKGHENPSTREIIIEPEVLRDLYYNDLPKPFIPVYKKAPRT